MTRSVSFIALRRRELQKFPCALMWLQPSDETRLLIHLFELRQVVRRELWDIAWKGNQSRPCSRSCMLRVSLILLYSHTPPGHTILIVNEVNVLFLLRFSSVKHVSWWSAHQVHQIHLMVWGVLLSLAVEPPLFKENNTFRVWMIAERESLKTLIMTTSGNKVQLWEFLTSLFPESAPLLRCHVLMMALPSVAIHSSMMPVRWE